jgi:hypothetical protein
MLTQVMNLTYRCKVEYFDSSRYTRCRKELIVPVEFNTAIHGSELNSPLSYHVAENQNVKTSKL